MKTHRVAAFAASAAAAAVWCVRPASDLTPFEQTLVGDYFVANADGVSPAAFRTDRTLRGPHDATVAYAFWKAEKTASVKGQHFGILKFAPVSRGVRSQAAALWDRVRGREPNWTSGLPICHTGDEFYIYFPMVGDPGDRTYFCRTESAADARSKELARMKYGPSGRTQSERAP